ncbi:MAG: ABC transporter permease [Clostridiales bacterium]|nr:ABC transporter permease [Clostridiales bacterium]
MKLLSSYIKEMKIAARGFYFYIEIGMAVIILAVLLFAVNEFPTSSAKEFIYYDMSKEIKSLMLQEELDDGTLELAEPTQIKMKAALFSVKNKETNETKTYTYDEEIYHLDTYKVFDQKTGKLQKTIIETGSEDDLIRLAWQEKTIGAAVGMNEAGEASTRYYLQGYETARFQNLLYILQNESPATLQAAMDGMTITKLENAELLNTRQSLVPLLVVLMGALMGFFIAIAYIFLDKDEGVIRAYAVTPSTVWKYLLSKLLVIITTVIVSSSIFTIPVMGAQPHYLLFYTLLIVSSFAFSSLGILIATFFDSMSKTFGALYVFLIAMMLPAFSYYVPSFDPLWLRFFPTYPLLQGMKEIMMKSTDVNYVLLFSGVYLAGGIFLFLFANLRFKKTLAV